MTQEFPEWLARLGFSPGKELPKNAEMVKICFQMDPRLEGIAKLNVFDDRVYIQRIPPWPSSRNKADYPRQAVNFDFTGALVYMQGANRVRCTKDNLKEGMLYEATRLQYHPVLDYFSSLQWDNQPRIATFLSRALGIEQTPYLEAVSIYFLVQAIARIMTPGCKADSMLILEGGQGIGKSSFVPALFKPEWSSGRLSEVGSKDSLLELQGKWCVEVAELDSMNKAQTTTIKSFLTTTSDYFRKPYAAIAEECARSSVFVGTTNHETYLKDDTGNRRFWPVRCEGDIDLAWVRENRDQLWAEALGLYNDGQRWWFDKSDIDLAVSAQTSKMQALEDVWRDPVEDWLRTADPINGFTMSSCLSGAVSLETAQQDRRAQLRMGSVLRSLGWDSKARRVDGKLVRRWFPVEEVE